MQTTRFLYKKLFSALPPESFLKVKSMQWQRKPLCCEVFASCTVPKTPTRPLRNQFAPSLYLVCFAGSKR